MLHYDLLRRLTDEHRMHHETEAEVERLALDAQGCHRRRAGRPPLARRLQHLRSARRDAMDRAAYVVVTVWPRR
jgi:hypothetical protein